LLSDVLQHITGCQLMNYETLIVITVAWLAIGLAGFRWAAVVTSRENASLGKDNEHMLEESSLRQADLSRELEATRAELLSLRTECAALRGKHHAAVQ